MIEVEREDKSVSILICFLDYQENKTDPYQQVLRGLINAWGAWDKEQLRFNNIDFLIFKAWQKGYQS